MNYLAILEAALASAPEPKAIKATNHPENVATLASFTRERVANSFDFDEYEERAAIVEANGIERTWAESYATLCAMSRPADYSHNRWEQIIADAGAFMDGWGSAAPILGWRSIEVFGVLPTLPGGIYMGVGLIPVLKGRRLIALSPTRARIACENGTYETFYRKDQKV